MGQLVYKHVYRPTGPDHAVTPKRIAVKNGARRMVCGSCEQFVMMVPVE